MSKHLLQIDVAKSKQANKKDLIQIKFKNSDALQLNFPKLFIQSEYIQNKYKYPEAIDMIQDEFDDIEISTNLFNWSFLFPVLSSPYKFLSFEKTLPSSVNTRIYLIDIIFCYNFFSFFFFQYQYVEK